MLSKIKEAIEYINSKTQIKPETGKCLCGFTAGFHFIGGGTMHGFTIYKCA
jgi:hypothetical protein